MYLRLSPYQEILQGVLISLQINEGIIKVTGKPGAGKTAFCSQLFQELQSQGQPAVFFLKPPSSALALQNDILDNLKLDPTGNFTRTLTTWLLARSAENKLLVLIFDDAQQLEAQTFSAIRMLCNIQDQARGLVRVVLCGNEELDAKLATPALRAVTQFLNQSFTLPYLTQEQVRDFCQAWWQHTGHDMKPLGDKALEKLFVETRGHPGILQARLNQGTTGAEPADRQLADSPSEAVVARPYRYRGRKPTWIPALIIVAALTLAGAGLVHLYFAPQSAQPGLASVPTPPAAVVEPAAQAAVAVETEATGLTAASDMVEAAAATAVADAPEPVPADSELEDAAAQVPAVSTATGAEFPDNAEPRESVAQAQDADQAEDAVQAESAEQAESVVQEESSESAAPAEASAQAAALPPVDEFIAAWTASWQSRDLDAYLAHYHPDFAPAQGTRAAWEQQRRRVIGNASGIMITVDAPEFSGDAEDGARVVRFWLNYSAENYADRTLKELTLVPVEGAWKIRAENNLSTERL